MWRASRTEGAGGRTVIDELRFAGLGNVGGQEVGECWLPKVVCDALGAHEHQCLELVEHDVRYEVRAVDVPGYRRLDCLHPLSLVACRRRRKAGCVGRQAVEIDHRRHAAAGVQRQELEFLSDLRVAPHTAFVIRAGSDDLGREDRDRHAVEPAAFEMWNEYDFGEGFLSLALDEDVAALHGQRGRPPRKLFSHISPTL